MIFWRDDTQHNDIQHNDNQHEGVICDIQHDDTGINAECQILFIGMPNECYYAECRYGDCRGFYIFNRRIVLYNYLFASIILVKEASEFLSANLSRPMPNLPSITLSSIVLVVLA